MTRQDAIDQFTPAERRLIADALFGHSETLDKESDNENLTAFDQRRLTRSAAECRALSEEFHPG